MKKKKNEYKPQRYKKVLRSLLSLLGTAVLAYVFVIVGYSVAKPFGEIGEIKPVDSFVLDDEISEQMLEDVQTENSEENFKAYWLKESEIESLETLDTLTNAIGKDYSMVVVPLKIEGGKLNFSTAYEEAIMAEVGNNLDLKGIYNTIKNKGYTPVAAINSMQDNLYPLSSKNAGFIVESTKKLWYDTQDASGKPWLNPASTETKQYLSAITGEIAQAGFKYIVCTDMEYPSFSEAALSDIGGIVNETDRYLELVDNVNSMTQVAEDRGSTMWLEISAYDVLNSTCEVYYKPIMLETKKYILEINLDEFKKEMKIDGKKVDFSKMATDEKIEAICENIEGSIYKSSYIPVVTASTLSMKQKQDIADVFEKLGYDSYMIK